MNRVKESVVVDGLLPFRPQDVRKEREEPYCRISLALRSWIDNVIVQRW
ncbi:MAG: hypothetical protein HYX72_01085 [Acidobacteria bacterium]|nr:hypothetical protein [Acidobacteriota bacterium]